jgi:ABC-type nickel/cobalt efflux system permease component RcnA
VAAEVLDQRGVWRGAVLALIITVTHTGSVLLVAASLWFTRTSRYGAINSGLARVAGFAIAAIGLWRVGRHLAGVGEHDSVEFDPCAVRSRSMVALGVAGGMVPCWDAVALIVLAETVGRLGLGLGLLVGFSAGMAIVLVAVGALAARLGGLLFTEDRENRWTHRLGIASGLALAGIGVYLLVAN